MGKNKLWGGRFNKQTHHLVEAFSNSIHFDAKLAEYDCIGSLIHIDVLRKANLLNAQEHAKLKSGLKKILLQVQRGTFKIDPRFEDIHSYIQHLLERDPKVKNVALKLHTCRSRNDQIVFDTKLFCLYQIFVTQEGLNSLVGTFKQLAKNNNEVFIPGYTHLQHAMPISLSEYFLAYVEMFLRDDTRLRNAFDNIQLTLGSGALAGTFIDKSKYEQALGSFLKEKNLMIKATNNSIDTVSDRDFVVEILSVLSIIGMHLSRLSEDMILWASTEFGFIDIDDAFCTGSSLMPQKKNPDVLELVRGNTGRLYGNLMNVLVMMKGLPLSYNRDMQNDKEPLFDSLEIVQKEIAVLSELFKNISFNVSNINTQLNDESLYATDMADFLVQRKVPFKEAHRVIGQLIRLKHENNIELADMPDSLLKKIHPLLNSKDIKSIINPKTSVRSKKSVRRRKS